MGKREPDMYLVTLPLSQVGIVMHDLAWISLGAELALRGPMVRAPSA